MSDSPTRRSLETLRAAGWLCEVVEHWNPYAKVRHDLFNIGDILAVGEDLGFLLVQTTAGANNAAPRRQRITEDEKKAESLRRWLKAGGRFELHNWRLAGLRGTRKTWQCRIEWAELSADAACGFRWRVTEP